MTTREVATDAGPWTSLLDELWARREATIDRMVEQLQAEIPSYALVPGAALRPGVERDLEDVLRGVRSSPEAATEAAVADLAEVGELRVHQGIPVEDMLRGWRVAIQLLLSESRVVADELGVGAATLFEFAQAVLGWADLAMALMAKAHRRAELELARQDEQARTEFVRAVLMGSLPSAELRIRGEAYGLDPSRRYCAFRARCDEPDQPALRRQLGLDGAGERRIGLAATIEGDLAGFLAGRPNGGVSVPVGLGPPVPIHRLERSYRSATRTLATLQAFDRPGLHALEDLGLLPAVVADTDLGDLLAARYLEPLRGSQSEPELRASLSAFFECGMHVERTAEQLFIHPNTLRYRLRRFQELCGADLTDPVEAMQVWWAVQYAAAGRGAASPGQAGRAEQRRP